jgi:DNA modification methylase
VLSGVADVIKLAEKNYIIGDTFKGLAEMRSTGSVGFIECDPPYGINLNEVKSGKDNVGSTVTTYNEVASDKYQQFLTNLSAELYRVSAPNSWMVFWFGPTWFAEVINALRAGGWLVDDIPGIWIKPQGQTLQPEIYLARAYEPFFICRKGKPILMKRGRVNTFQYSTVPGSMKYHPTERPVELIEELLETFCPPGTKVLVPFLGSGATIRAAYNQGLQVHGWDLNPEYKDKFMLKVEEDSRALLNSPDES